MKHINDDVALWILDIMLADDISVTILFRALKNVIVKQLSSLRLLAIKTWIKLLV